MEYNEKIILSTLIYSDIFDYPLTEEEIWRYAINRQPLNKKKFFATLHRSQLFTVEKQFYTLRYKKEIIQIRLDNQATAQEKINIAQSISRLLSIIPTIRFIGITGSLSMMNTKEKDDIDFIIITQKKTIWISRLLTIGILELTGRRRKRQEKDVKDKICVNMFIDESALAFPKAWQDLFTAHEIVQIKPLFERGKIYAKFLRENVWVKDFLPNALEVSELQNIKVSKEKSNVTILLGYAMALFNSIAKQAQLWYMKKQLTSEIITDSLLAFYKDSTKKNVLEMFEKRLKQYEI